MIHIKTYFTYHEILLLKTLRKESKRKFIIIINIHTAWH